jgi:hypothetical protein
MVIFGAGASFDSLPPTSWPSGMGDTERESQPPLTKDLFAPRRSFVGIMSSLAYAPVIVARLRNVAVLDGDIEEAVQELVERVHDDPPIARQLMALRYYLQSVLGTCSTQWLGLSGGASNYVDLLELIRRYRGTRNVLVVSFNYDTLLENAWATTLGNPLRRIEDYIAGAGGWWLLKPHGSVNWSRVLDRPRSVDPSKIIGIADTLDLDGPIVVASSITTNQMQIPAIAVPTTSKSLFECPPSHISTLKRALPTVDRVLTVGWKAGEEEFLDLCRDLLPQRSVRGLVVDGDAGSAALPASRLEAAFPIESTIQVSPAPGFSQLLLRHIGDLVAFMGDGQ